jgi:hypothetical protein
MGWCPPVVVEVVVAVAELMDGMAPTIVVVGIALMYYQNNVVPNRRHVVSSKRQQLPQEEEEEIIHLVRVGLKMMLLTIMPTTPTMEVPRRIYLPYL